VRFPKRAREAREADPASSDARIVKALRQKAERGDVNAARELREWAEREERDTLHPEAWLRLCASEERNCPGISLGAARFPKLRVCNGRQRFY